MTQSAEQERAEFEALCIEKGWNMTAIMLTTMPPEFSCYADIGTQRAYIAWQAARRAPSTQAQRAYLSDSQINAIADANMGLDTSYEALQKFAHAIERAYGIGKEDA